MDVRTLYVLKKVGFDQKSEELCRDLRDNLGILALEDVRTAVRYDVRGLDETLYREAMRLIFSEPQVDEVFEEPLSLPGYEWAFGVRPLPAQFDQRVDSLLSALQLLEPGINAAAVSSKVFFLKGKLSVEDVETIKSYCINPVDSCEIDLNSIPDFCISVEDQSQSEEPLAFLEKSREELSLFCKEQNLAMTLEDLVFCQAYFKEKEKRNPTMTEIKVIDTYWSDHCRHTTFATRISQVVIEDGPLGEAIAQDYQAYQKLREEVYGERTSEKEICLMDLATIGAKALRKAGYLADLDISEEVNACGIHVMVDVDGKEEPWLLLFKNETHNHPTEIEPFGGAATCIGGAIRDPLSGRGYVFGAMRVSGSGDPRQRVAETPTGKLPQRKITLGALAGYSSYGNQIGVATGKVKEFYHPGFQAKRLECGAVLGAVPIQNVRREEPAAGDVVVLLGGRTGKDGIGGATGSSKNHNKDSLLTGGSEVQKGNAVTERKIQRLMRNPQATSFIKRCNDFGAGGVAVAIGELCDGLLIDLDQIPLKNQALNATEITLSESQERMAMVVEKKDLPLFLELAAKENLEATKVADVTEEKRLIILYQGNPVVNLSRDFLNTGGVVGESKARILPPKGVPYFSKQTPKETLAEVFFSMAQQIDNAPNRGMVEHFDASIGAGTILAPFGGAYYGTENDALAMKMPVLHGKSDSAALMSYGYHPYLSEYSPYLGAQYAVLESVARVVACGGNPGRVRLSFQEYFERLGEDPDRWGKPLGALLGALKAQMELKTGAIGGKDSMSGSFENLHVPPTLISFAVAPAKASAVISQDIKAERGGRLYLLPLIPESDGQIDYKRALKNMKALHQGILSGAVWAAQAVGPGGIALAIANMCYGNRAGIAFGSELAEFEKSQEAAGEKGSILSREWIGSFLFQAESSGFLDKELPVVELGPISDSFFLTRGEEQLDLHEVQRTQEHLLEEVFRVKAKVPEAILEQGIPERTYVSHFGRKSISTCKGKPRALILTFPGTNCEYDMARQFEQAGAKPDIFIFRNRTRTDIEESIREMESAFFKSQIVAIPGGFSLGDEPDGSAKFIAAVFHHPRIKEAVSRLLKDQDGLMLGICNGFQALIKLGLVPFGEIRKPKATNPTLTFNTIGRHEARYISTRVMSNNSPWMRRAVVGGIYTIPISHGEGRLMIKPQLYETLLKNGQVATTYVNPKGEPSYDIAYNPNGSSYAIEGLFSPDGRIFGKMGHSERVGEHIGKNIPGEHDQRIFQAGVDYFR